LPNSWQESTELTAQTDSISIYSDALADTREIIEAQKNIKRSFPALPAGFYDMFDDRIRANRFTVQRLADAVDCVIDNCIFPQPTIAQFISYDRTLKYKTYDEMCKDALTSDSVWQQWLPVKFPDRPRVVWVHENDIAKYRLQEHIVNK
jgi:predicted RNase H-like nuclease